jgi:hypothetical protein
MKLLSSCIVGMFVLVVTLLATPNVRADQFNFSLSGTGVSASGTFTTNPQSGGTFLVTGLTGSLNGGSMSLLPPLTNYNSNNLLYPTSPFVDLQGIEFAVRGLGYDLYGGGGQDFLVNTSICSASSGGCSFGQGAPVALTVTTAPETSVLSLIGFGALVIAIATRRKRLA